VLKKRETIRQLVLSLQHRLNPDLQYDVQQGTVPPAVVMPETAVSDMTLGTAEDAVLNPVAPDGDTADMIQTSTEQTDGNEHNLPLESDNNIAAQLSSVPDHLPDCDVPHVVYSAPSQIVATAADADAKSKIPKSVITDSNDNAVDGSLPPTSELPVCSTENSSTSKMMEKTVSDDICQGTPVSICTSTARHMSEHSIVSPLAICQHLVNEQTGPNILVADSGHMPLSTDITNATEESCTTDASSSNLHQISDTASCADDSVSHYVVPCLNESFVGNTEMQNSLCQLSAAETENR